jgi:hypothetical protein
MAPRLFEPGWLLCLALSAIIAAPGLRGDLGGK